MRLFEFEQEDLQTSVYDPQEDKVNVHDLSDTRKKKLTLKDINKLKKLRAMRELENAKRQDLLGIMYALPADDQGGGMGGGFGGM